MFQRARNPKVISLILYDDPFDDRIQDGCQDGRNCEPKSTSDNDCHSKCSCIVMLVFRCMFVFKGRESNCYVMILFGDLIDNRIQDGRPDSRNNESNIGLPIIMILILNADL